MHWSGTKIQLGNLSICLSLLCLPLPALAENFSILSEAGEQRFRSAMATADFFPLANQFEAQQNKLYCGPATVAMVLNALRQPQLRRGNIQLKRDLNLLDPTQRKLLPIDHDFLFNRYTQNNIFDFSYRVVDGIKPKTMAEAYGQTSAPNQQPDYGFQLRQLHQLFQAHGAHSLLRVVDDKLKIEKIRSEIVSNLAAYDNYVVVNYHRPVLGQSGGGHISPLGAYDEATDSVLILDVNPLAADWLWVDLNDLVSAMRTQDGVENRGYLLVSDE